MCGPAEAAIISAVVTTIVSTTTSSVAAAQAADQQSRANEEAAKQAAQQAAVRNAAQNQRAQEQAAAEGRQRLQTERERTVTQGANAAQFEGLEGNYLSDVSASVDLSAAEAQSAITVQGLFAEQNARLDATTTQLQMDNRISNLPTGGNAGLTIASNVVGGISSGINVGGAVYNSGAFGAFDEPQPDQPEPKE